MTQIVRLIFLVGLALATYYVAALFGHRWAYLALAVYLATVATIWIWLPRAAHRRFAKGDYGRSAIYYHVLRRCRLAKSVRATIDVSLAACALARQRWRAAQITLERVDAEHLEEASRAVWLNNRAYAAARAGEDKERAIGWVDEAIDLRPDLPGLRHTRAVALLSLGRVDEAIHELEVTWRDSGGAINPFLEAERCYDLGRAWLGKGEDEYAQDYFQRSQRIAPQSFWAQRARRHLDGPRLRAAEQLI